jgi:protein gp37
MAKAIRDLFPLPVAAAVRPAEDLAALAAEIKAEHAAGEGAARKGLAHFRNAGAALIKARAQCGPGKWLKWVRANLPFDRRTATNYMRVAARWETVSHAEGMRDALRLLTEDGPEPSGECQSRGKLTGGVTATQWDEADKEARARLLGSPPKGKFNEQETDDIEWALWSWNPVTGCRHNCPYCYARDIANDIYEGGFEPMFWPGRLRQPASMKFPQKEIDAEPEGSWRRRGLGNVFACSMADLFGGWVPGEWIEAVLEQVRAAPRWHFIFLTKFPVRMAEFTFPDNAWVGTSVDCQARVANAEKAFRKVKAGVKWLSCEPLIEPLKFKNLGAFQWLVLGGASPSSKTPEWRPPTAWVGALKAEAARLGVMVYEKANLHRRDRSYPGAPDVPPTEAPPKLRYLATPEGKKGEGR